MNVELIKMDPAEAREQLRAYRRQLHRRVDAEYEAVAKGLAALADGTPILSLPEAIRTGGFDDVGRPRLAIARADRQQVKLTRSGHSTTARFYAGAVDRWGIERGRGGPSLDIRIDTATRPPASIDAYALVPMIPANVRNSVRFTDRQCFVLWEVEEWASSPQQAGPDRDPFLLRHLHGDAYAVLAEWDLTPLEQMVMAGRAGAQ
jgi:hypothetical protein